MPLPLLFESWNCRPATVPPRSRLYSLKPMGIGTPFVESLTGYASRLADAHAVSVGNLVGRELSLVGSKPTHPFGPFVPRAQTVGSHGFCGTRSANGLGEIAKRWVVALERGTLQPNLRFLTLLPFEGVFSKGRIFRRTRAWCSACYAQWRCTGATVYEQLLWTMRLVTICPRHRQPLEEVCPNCGERMKPLGAYARPGHCSKCLQWLAGEDTSVSPTQSAQKSDADAVWRAQALGELFAAAPQLISPGAVFQANFRACVEAAAEGNVLAFAQASRTSNPGVTYILEGRGLPEMGTLLRICHYLNIPLMVFLVNDPSAAALHWQRGKEVVLKNHSCRMVPLSRTREQVLVTLQAAVHEQPPPSLSEIARRLNFKSVGWLRHTHPALSKQISANYRKSGQSHWWRKPGAARICERADIRDLLERSLAKEHSVSPGAIAVSLGYANEGYIQNRYPELCRAIREKIKQEKKERINAMQMALKNALNNEHPPSLDEVATRLGYAGSGVLRIYFSTLCDKILARRRLHRKLQVLELKRNLQAALLEWPAPCVASVCRRLNMRPHVLQKTCPHEYALIRSTYVRNSREIRERRQQQLRQEVHRVVEKLHREGKYPSTGRVSALLSKTTLNHWTAIRAAVKAARQELRVPDLY